MKCDFKLQNYPITKLQNRQRGYVLLTLMLFVALLSIAALAVLPEIKQQIQRDREDEMRHRGTQYMRAIKAFYKKNNRYPTRIEELEGTNNIRYLRKRFKDPMSRDRESHKEKDFKLLRTGDPELARLYSEQMPGVGGIAPGVGGALNGGNPQSPFGGPQSPAGGVPSGASPQAGTSQGQNVTTSGDDEENDNENGPGNQGQSQNNPTVTSSSPNGVGGPLQSNTAGGNSPSVFGGGPIMGVVSTSKQKSIREFGDKIKHYNEWLFVYDPTSDRGGLIVGPVVPSSNTKGGIGGIPAGTLATQSQQGNPAQQVQPPAQPPQQNPTPQMPPDQEP